MNIWQRKKKGTSKNIEIERKRQLDEWSQRECRALQEQNLRELVEYRSKGID